MTTFKKLAIRAAFCFLPACLLPAVGVAQGLDPSQILKPLKDDWPTYNGDYSGRRYSALTQLNQSNVKNLTLAWASRVTAGSGGGGGGRRIRRRRADHVSAAKARRKRAATPTFALRFWKSTASCICRRPTTPGPWMRATATSSGITSGRPKAARTSAIAGWHVAQLALHGDARRLSDLPGRQDRQGSAGTKRSPISTCSISRPRRRSSSAITFWWARATISTRRDICNPSIPRPATCSGSGTPCR